MARQVGVFRRQRPAFTLIELLVVITIIGVMVAVLLPAVQMAREASRRSHCANNLKQMGAAVAAYHDIYKCFPPGGVTMGKCCSTPSFTSWTISILPQLEQGNLAQQYRHGNINEDPTNATVRETLLSVFLCPSEPNNSTTMLPETGPGNLLKYAVGSYRGMGGRSDGVNFWDVDSYANLPYAWRGVFHTIDGKLRQESFSTALDGASNTWLVGEYGTRSHERRRTFWAYSYSSYNKSDAVPQSRTILNDYDRCVLLNGPGGDQPCKRAWGSFHPGGVQFVMIDGSVHFVSRLIDMTLFTELATIDGGEAASL
jgi:prepilin-type N-terminal cleavage/methylation domain-containing protein